MTGDYPELMRQVAPLLGYDPRAADRRGVARYRREQLQQLLGPGGVWIDPDGQRDDKLQLHWRLGKPAIGEQLAQLKQVRDMATSVVGGANEQARIANEQARMVTRRRLPSGFGDAPTSRTFCGGHAVTVKDLLAKHGITLA